MLHVTHDYEEAIALGTRIAVVDKGRILQTGSPDEIFHHPKNEFIASFTGIRNFFPAKLQTTNNTTFAVINDQIAVRTLHDQKNQEVFVLIRGEDVLISAVMVDTSATNSFSGIVKEIIPARVGLDVMIDIGIEIHAWVTHDSAKKFELKPGSQCWIHFKATAVRIITR
jgi:molybdopterin-binding protein